MGKVEIASAPSVPCNDSKRQLVWADNPSIQKLLDVISSILADEYIQIVKQNKDVFQKEAANESSDIR